MSVFSILEDVKTVNIGNDMAVTLSIGIGMNGESYAQKFMIMQELPSIWHLAAAVTGSCKGLR